LMQPAFYSLPANAQCLQCPPDWAGLALLAAFRDGRGGYCLILLSEPAGMASKGHLS
jgi:hypothetical protein